MFLRFVETDPFHSRDVLHNCMSFFFKHANTICFYFETLKPPDVISELEVSVYTRSS